MAYFTIEGYNSYSGCDITVTASLPPINGQPINKYYTLGSLQTLSISTHQDKRPVRSLGVINAKDYVMGPRTIAGSMVFAVFNKHFATEIMNDLGASGGKNVILPDEIPALNITVNFANEYGRMSRMAIYGVKIINEGQVMSINDLYTENTYQFVALGLEPLNVNIDTSGDISTNTQQPNKYGSADIPSSPGVENNQVNVNGQKSRGVMHGYSGKDLVVLDTTNSTDALLKDKNFLENSGSNIAEQIQNNNKVDKNSILGLEILNPYNPITLSVKVEQPRGINDSGYAVFTLTPEQNQGIIYIYPTNAKDMLQEYSIILGSKKNLMMTLPDGSYQAQYVNSSAETSNTVYFSINKYIETQTSSHTNTFPIIDKVSDSFILVSNTNYNHNTLVYFEEGHSYYTIPLNKNVTKIEGLRPNTEYKIFTTNNNSINGSMSQIITVKTYKDKNQEVHMLNDFINFNKDLLLKLKDSEINLDVDNHYSLIDMILTLPESHEKQEMLIYAVELSNQLTLFHNKENTNYMIEDAQEEPFSTKVTLVNYDKINIYNNVKGKSIFNTTLKKTEEEVFYIKPNTYYTLCGITDNGDKSVKTHIAACKNSSAAELENYRRTGVYKDLDLTEYLNRYNTFTYNSVMALAIRDKHYSDIDILHPPYIYQDNGIVYANINYLNLNRFCKYYLCCAELYSALDYSPKRKIEFTIDDINSPINLNDHYLGLNPTKKYLFWIEDFQFIKISKPYLYINESLEEYKEIQTTYKQELYSKLLNIKKDLIREYGNIPVVEDIFNYVFGLQPPQKDLYNTLVSEIINGAGSSYYVHDVMIPLYELLKIIHTYNTTLNIPDIEINFKDRTVQFKDLRDYYICAIEYSEDTQNVGTRLTEDVDTVQYGKKGYTIIYLMSHNMVYKTGFILIDNENGTYTCTEDLDDYIKKVGDK